MNVRRALQAVVDERVIARYLAAPSLEAVVRAIDEMAEIFRFRDATREAAAPGDVVAAALSVDEGASPTADQVETLVDLARDGDAATFRDLASMLGVAPAWLDALWAGTVARWLGDHRV